MKRYRVRLDAQAYVQQVQYVNADSVEEAEKRAREDVGSHAWEYVELIDASVEVASCKGES
jgi:hypothetical protein